MRRAAFLLVLPCLVLPLAGGAQAPQGVSSPIAQTVSVKNLAIPPNAREHLEKAKNAGRLGREAIFQAELARAIAIAPGFAEAYLTRADHANRLRRHEAAVDDALRARSLDASTAWPCVVLATAYNGLARYQDAFLVLANLRGEGASSWQADYEMARAEIGRGNAESALHWGQMAFARAPASFSDTRLLLANALQLAHRWREASEQMEAYLALPAPAANTGFMNREAVRLALQHTRLLAAAAQDAHGD